jgi:hypothetical protein
MRSLTKSRFRRLVARRGRKPKPTELHKLHGTFDASRHGKRRAEPQATSSLAELPPPRSFDAEHLAEWQWLVAHAPAGLLCRWDRDAAEHYVRLRVRFLRAWRAQEAMDAGQAMPYVIEGKNGLRVSPYLRVMNQCTDQLIRLACGASSA